MKLKKVIVKYLILSIISIDLIAGNAGFNIFLNDNIINVYAKKKPTNKKVLKKGKKSLVSFKSVTSNGDSLSFYVDKKNNKIYCDIYDYMNRVNSFKKTGYVLDFKKKSVKIRTDKKSKNYYRYMTLPKNIYGNSIKINFDIDGKESFIDGFIVKSSGYRSAKNKTMLVDFDMLSKKLEMDFQKDIRLKKYLLLPKLADNKSELKSLKTWYKAYKDNKETKLDGYYLTDRWASPIKNYLYEEDGNLIRLFCDESKSKKEVVVSFYDNTYNQIKEKRINYNGKKFGGFYHGNNYNYLFFGNNNSSHNNSKEIIKIIKLDRDFNETAQASVSNCFTVAPFDAGSFRCVQEGDKILIHTSRLRYDGHQSQLTVVFDENSMRILNADDLGGFQKNHISHDFNEFALADSGEFVVVDHGDAYPRTLQLSYLSTYDFSPTKEVTVLNIPGKTGSNQTGVSIGSVIKTDSAFLIGCNKIDYSKATAFDSFDIKGKDVYKRDVVLYAVDKSSLNVTEHKFTDYSKNKKTSYTAPKMVKIDDSRIMLLWNKITGLSYSKKNTLQYKIVDYKGNSISEIKSIDNMKINNEDPIVYNGKVVWSACENGRIVLNKIDY